jgi:hypothetical protein
MSARKLLFLVLLAAACSPVTVSRIGPDVPPRPAGCFVEVLDPGRVPDRPHRAVGVVALENCQDYRTEPCRGWLVDATCGLGGHVAWIDEGGRPDSGLGPMIFRVTVAAYVSDLPTARGDDPFAEEMRRRRQAADCDGDHGADPDAGAVDRCVE